MKKKILAVMLAAVLAVAGAVPGMTASAGDSDESYDVTKPVINSIEIDRQGETLSEGDTVTISMDAYDAEMGIKSVKVGLRRENSKSTYSLYFNEESEKYETKINITSNTNAGKFFISYIEVVDTNGNYTKGTVGSGGSTDIWNGDSALYWYNVETETEVKDDTQAPIIESVHLTKNGKELSPEDILVVGDIVQISVKASDNVKLADFATIYFDLEKSVNNNADNKYISLSLLEDTQSYEGSFEIKDNLYPGKWRLYYVNIWDTSSNQTLKYYDSDLIKDMGFIIQNDDFDTEPPLFHSLSVDGTGEFFRSGDSVKITAEITDNVGIDYVVITLYALADITEYVKTIELTQNENTGFYEGVFVVTDKTYPCEWYIDHVYIRDKGGNYKNIYSNPATDMSFYMNKYIYVKQGKNTFVNPTYKVNLRYEENGKSLTKELKVPRRTTAEELAQYFTPQNSKFIGWDVPDYGVLDNELIYALYDETPEEPTTGDETESTEESSSVSEPDTSEEIINKGDIVTIGELQYKVIENEEVSVYGTLNKKITDINIPKMVVYGGKEWKVTKIGSSALKNSNNLIHITIPEGITGIEDSAFKNCKSLTDITIPEGVTSIGNSAFKNCKNLASVTIPESVITIADDAFTNTAAVIYSTDNAYARIYAAEHKIEWKSLKAEEPTNTVEITSDESGSTEETTLEIPTASAVLSEQQIVEAVSKVTATEAGSAVKISMGRATVVPKDILEAARGKDVNIILEMEGYSWTINGTTVLSKNLEDINLEVTRHTNYIPNRIVSALAGSNPVEQISLTHNGHFGFTANLTLNVGNQYTGQDGNLYYYDSDGKMVFINAGTIDNNGNVSLAFSHASDYAIVITKKKVSVTDGTDTGTLPETGDMVPMKLFALLAVSVGTIVFVNIMGKKNKIISKS